MRVLDDAKKVTRLSLLDKAFRCSCLALCCNKTVRDGVTMPRTLHISAMGSLVLKNAILNISLPV